MSPKRGGLRFVLLYPNFRSENLSATLSLFARRGANKTAARGIPWKRVPPQRGADTPGGPDAEPSVAASPRPTAPFASARCLCTTLPRLRATRARLVARIGLGPALGCHAVATQPAYVRRSRTQRAPSLLSPRARTSAALRAGCGPRPRPKRLRAKDYPARPLQQLSRCPAERRPPRDPRPKAD